MKCFSWVAAAAISVACTTLYGAPLGLVYAQDAELSTDVSLDAESSVEATQIPDKIADPECLAIGYDLEALDCRLCNLLALSVSMQQSNGFPTGDSPEEVAVREKQFASERAVATCQKCCTDVEAIEALATKQQYARVVLEVCTCKFGRLPKIANFVQQHASKHDRLEVKYMNARMPHLLFYDENDTKQEEISIASWDEETISEFIESKLKKKAEGTDPVEELLAEDTTKDGQEEEEKTEEKSEEEEENKEAQDVVEVEVSADGE